MEPLFQTSEMCELHSSLHIADAMKVKKQWTISLMLTGVVGAVAPSGATFSRSYLGTPPACTWWR